MITMYNSWTQDKVFSSEIADLEFAVSFERAKVTVSTIKGLIVEKVYEEVLYPDKFGHIRLVDVERLIEPYSDRYTTFGLKADIEEQKVAMSNNQETVTVKDTVTVQTVVLTCRARIMNMTAAKFCNDHFLTLLDGTRQTASGWKEVLTFLGDLPAAPTCSALYTDGTRTSFQLSVTESGDFRMLDVSPDNFLSTGRTLAGYTVNAGNRRQEYEVIYDFPADIAPVLLFVNSFGVEEIAYCTGEHKQASSFDRKQSRFDRTKVSYEIVEKETFRADTGILSYPMANWWREVFRSKSVKLMRIVDGIISLDDFIPVVLSSEKAELSNAPDHLPRFTFEYEYADRNHNIWDNRREGRIFDFTFDNTFN